MDRKDEIRRFLTSRRARVQPDQVGLPIYTSRRRVPGLRREEVAMVAGVSAEYYAQLERGDLGAASEGVLAGLDRALLLDGAERQYLRVLARSAPVDEATSVPESPEVRPAVRQVLDTIGGAAAFVRNRRLDYVAQNALGRALLAPMYDHAGEGPVNQALFVFCCQEARTFYDDWPRAAAGMTAMLRLYAGSTSVTDGLPQLIDELSARSETFREHWERHDVRLSGAGVKRFNHPLVGPVDVAVEAMQLNADPELTLLVATVEPGSASAAALAELELATATA